MLREMYRYLWILYRAPWTRCAGPALNTVVLWNSLHLDRAAERLAADGFPVTDGLPARLSPPRFDSVNFLGRYAFFRPQEAGRTPTAARTVRRLRRREREAGGLIGSTSLCTVRCRAVRRCG